MEEVKQDTFLPGQVWREKDAHEHEGESRMKLKMECEQ